MRTVTLSATVDRTAASFMVLALAIASLLLTIHAPSAGAGSAEAADPAVHQIVSLINALPDAVRMDPDVQRSVGRLSNLLAFEHVEDGSVRMTEHTLNHVPYAGSAMIVQLVADIPDHVRMQPDILPQLERLAELVHLEFYEDGSMKSRL